MTKDTTIHLPPIFDEHPDLREVAAAIRKKLAGDLTLNDTIHIVRTLSEMQSNVHRHIDHLLDGVSPVGLQFDLHQSQTIIATIQDAWSAYRDKYRMGMPQPVIDLRRNGVRVPVPAPVG